MAIKYHVQELPNMRAGEQAQFPMFETYSLFGNKAMVSRIAMESGIPKGAVMGTLEALPRSLKTYLLEGHSCRIDGLGTFSLSLTFDKHGQVRVKGLNLKVCPEFLRELKEEAEFELSQSEIVNVTPSKGHRDEHYALLEAWLRTHSQITLTEYANLAGVSVATASRELNYFCNTAGYGVSACGYRNRKVWVRKE